jgi:hypothetical protein
LPIENIIEFSMMAKKPGGGLKTYVSEVEVKKLPALKPALEQPDYPDAPSAPQPTPIVETAPEPAPTPRPKPDRKKLKVVKEETKPNEQTVFFTKLVEQMTDLKRPLTVEATVQTTEAHVERLFEIENAMLGTLHTMADRVQNIAETSGETQGTLAEVILAQRTLIEQLTEGQSRIVEAQSRIVDALALLTDKINGFAQTAPVVNPIVNVPPPTVVMQEGKRIKLVERDEKGLITKITEGYEEHE